jgi:hypothetical protein
MKNRYKSAVRELCVDVGAEVIGGVLRVAGVQVTRFEKSV